MSWRWMLLLFLLFWQCPLSAQETPEPGSSSTDGGLEQREGDKDGVVEPVATEEPTSSDGVDASPATDAAEVGTEQGGAVQDGMAAELPEQLPPGPPLNPEPQPFPSGSAEPVSDAGFEAWLYLRISLGFAGSASEEGKLDGALQWKAEDSSTRLSLQGCLGFDAIIERFFMLGVRVMLQSWKHEFLVETFGSDDVMLTHLDGIVGLRIPLLPSFQVYLRIPVGLTMTTEPTNMLDVLESRTGADWYLDFGTGWNVGLDLGAMYKVDERFALGVELSWLYVSLSQEGEVSTLYDERLDWERSFSFQQAALGLNLIYTP